MHLNGAAAADIDGLYCWMKVDA